MREEKKRGDQTRRQKERRGDRRKEIEEKETEKRKLGQKRNRKEEVSWVDQNDSKNKQETILND